MISQIKAWTASRPWLRHVSRVLEWLMYGLELCVVFLVFFGSERALQVAVAMLLLRAMLAETMLRRVILHVEKVPKTINISLRDP